MFPLFKCTIGKKNLCKNVMEGKGVWILIKLDCLLYTEYWNIHSLFYPQSNHMRTIISICVLQMQS